MNFPFTTVNQSCKDKGKFTVRSTRKGVPGINLNHTVKTFGGCGGITPRFNFEQEKEFV